LASTETVADALEHTSSELYIGNLHEKNVQVMAMEVVAAGVPGPLNVWVELSPWPSANSIFWPLPLPTSTLFWAAIGCGGGALAPTAPYIEVGTGVNLTPHGIMIPFNEYSYWMRVVVQTPAIVATAYWVVQVIVSGNSD
jgi:hypothetical protein